MEAENGRHASNGFEYGRLLDIFLALVGVCVKCDTEEIELMFIS
jgi:hypothetical protein